MVEVHLEAGMGFGKDFSVDEQTCKMQGKSEYKTCCGKFKRLGDGIQTDCIADDGYKWDFYFHNEPLDKEMLTKGNCLCTATFCICMGTSRSLGMSAR